MADLWFTEQTLIATGLHVRAYIKSQAAPRAATFAAQLWASLVLWGWNNRKLLSLKLKKRK